MECDFCFDKAIGVACDVDLDRDDNRFYVCFRCYKMLGLEDMISIESYSQYIYHHRL